MAKSKGFEPLTLLISAVAKGSQLGKWELMAYDYACDYYGESRVALQKNTHQVEGAERYDSAKRMGDIRYITVSALNLTQNIMTFNEIQKVMLEARGIQSLYSLFIHWPEATITNENDQSIDIQDLFARIPLTVKGMTFPEYERFTFMRTTYTRTQWNHLYMHSHVQTISESNPLKFKHVCLGSGPIKNTINTLVVHPDNQEAMMLFFWELDKVVHVESLTGVPYNRLSGVTSSSYVQVETIVEEYRGFLHDILRNRGNKAVKDFMASFFRAVEVPMAFRDGKYILGCSFLEFAVLITNYYKKWEDAYKKARQLGIDRSFYDLSSFYTNTYGIKDNKIWSLGSRGRSNRADPTTNPTFAFKDKTFTFTIIEDASTSDYTKCTLLDLTFVAGILNYMLTSINAATSYRYEEKPKEENDFWNEQYDTIVSNLSRSKGESFASISTTTAY